MTVWEKIPGYPNYEISDAGEVKNIKRDMVLKQRHDKYGYLRVGISDSTGKQTVFLIHRLVAMTFWGESKSDVDHINSCKTDNRLINLRYIEKSKHISLHKRGVLGSSHLRGENNGMSKLTENQVLSMRDERAAGALLTELAEKYKISSGNVAHITTGRAWPHLGGQLTRFGR